MSNSIIKDIDVVGSAGQSAIAPTPAIPARTVYETREVCKFVPIASLPGANPNASGDLSGVTAPTYAWVCTMQQVPVTYPAIPGTPGRPYIPSTLANDYHTGWNAGGRSIALFDRNGHVTFQARAAAVGVIVGLKVIDGMPIDYHGQNIDWGFSLARGTARIREMGVDVASVGGYTDDTVFGITRTRTRITYTMDGAVVRTVDGAPTDAVWLQADLYSGGDEVFNPTLAADENEAAGTLHGSLAATLPTFAGLLLSGHGAMAGRLPALNGWAASGFGAISHGFVAARLPHVLGLASGHAVASGRIGASLPRLAALVSDRPYSKIGTSLPRLSAEITSGLTAPAYGLVLGRLPPLYGLINGLVGATGGIDSDLPPLAGLMADRAYGGIDGSLPALYGGMMSVEGNENASMGSFGAATSSADAIPVLMVGINSTGKIVGTMVSTSVLAAEIMAQADIAGTMNGTPDHTATMMSVASFAALLGLPSDDVEVWCLNLDGLGTTRYTHYPFNSFGRLGERYFGAADGGLFALDADDDAGDPIRAVLGLGDLDFGNPQRKTVSECYIGMSASGYLYLKVVAEGREFIYRTRGYSDNVRQERISLGRGLQANYLTLELYNENGADFELDTVAFTVVNLSRRI